MCDGAIRRSDLALNFVTTIGDPLRSRNVTNAPSRHGEAFRKTVDRDRSLEHAREACDAHLLTCTPTQLVHMLRMLTFSGTHPHISDGHLLTPDEIVGTLLDGVLRKDS